MQHCVRAKGERLGEELRLIISQNKLMMYCASYRVPGGVGGGEMDNGNNRLLKNW